MIIYNNLEEIEKMPPVVLALGNFDGVHVGHKELIKAAVEEAKYLGIKSAVFTFSNHPKNIIPGARPVKNIIYQDEKAALIESLGVDFLINVEFNKEIMEMDPLDFIRKLLIDKFNAKETYSGFNYHFGYKGAGDVTLLQTEGLMIGFVANVMEPVTVDGEIVSSTLIREMIKSGDMEECAEMLGRNYDISGTVIEGNHLGKSLGFPTSNISIDDTMVTPPNGVYITYCIYNGVRYPGITNVGVKPTVGTYEKNMETHIFNFTEELYGKEIKVEFVKKTREEVKFKDFEALKAQIKKDCEEAKEYHGIK